MKATNKYLFNQTVDCHNCKHRKDEPRSTPIEDWCDIYTGTSAEDSSNRCLWLCSSMRTGITYNFLACGPLGQFYEPIE